VRCSIPLALALALVSACRSDAEAAAPAPPAAAASSAENALAPNAGVDATDEPDPPAEPEGVPGGGPDPLSLSGDVSASVGGPTTGRVTGGVPLPLHGPGYRFSPNKDPQSRYGTVELVAALVRAAGVVHEELPGNDLTIGDLGRPEGGDIPGHASHRAGRDVDVYFYLFDDSGAPFPAKAIPLDPSGEGTDYNDLADPADDVAVKIDVPRTWRFVQALLEDDSVYVQRIFVVEHVRTMLLAEAKRTGAPAAVRDLFGDLTCQPRAPHDDHLHIRVFCTAQDIGEGCEDGHPIYPWHNKRLAAAGTTAVIAKPAPKVNKPKPSLTSRVEARVEAGVMHEDVRAFLDRRKSWAKKPHPKRPYCR
jgi:penicillin-insensitive murein endopeptidase